MMGLFFSSLLVNNASFTSLSLEAKQMFLVLNNITGQT